MQPPMLSASAGQGNPLQASSFCGCVAQAPLLKQVPMQPPCSYQLLGGRSAASKHVLQGRRGSGASADAGAHAAGRAYGGRVRGLLRRGGAARRAGARQGARRQPGSHRQARCDLAPNPGALGHNVEQFVRARPREPFATPGIPAKGVLRSGPESKGLGGSGVPGSQLACAGEPSGGPGATVRRAALQPSCKSFRAWTCSLKLGARQKAFRQPGGHHQVRTGTEALQPCTMLLGAASMHVQKELAFCACEPPVTDCALVSGRQGAGGGRGVPAVPPRAPRHRRAALQPLPVLRRVPGACRGVPRMRRAAHAPAAPPHRLIQGFRVCRGIASLLALRGGQACLWAPA